GLAARAIGLLGSREGIEQLQELAENDQRTLRLYDHGVLSTVSVADLAAKALQEIE
ncbi:MAG: HEAT repeat domain-containing protein, partial [Candidatus Electrothrix sp. ATG1]|nr:HEAT repeat domain-containing protein [Candidatus Electrothrix sp. ATG1]